MGDGRAEGWVTEERRDPGFYEQSTKIFPSITEGLKKLCEAKGGDPKEIQRILITGHSLGGALATIGKPQPLSIAGTVCVLV